MQHTYDTKIKTWQEKEKALNQKSKKIPVEGEPAPIHVIERGKTCRIPLAAAKYEFLVRCIPTSCFLTPFYCGALFFPFFFFCCFFFWSITAIVLFAGPQTHKNGE